MNRLKYKSIFHFSLAGLFLLFLGFLALRHRVPGLTREFEQDEYAHFIVVIAGRHIADFLDKIGPNLQPALDFLLLRFLWVPTLGLKELSFRLPPLFISLCTQLLVFICAYWYINKKHQRSAFALLVALAVGLWAATHITEVFYATSSRHYALVALVSLVWSFMYFLLEANVMTWRFFSISLLFANAHFFALPLVAGAYGLEFLRKVPSRPAKATLLPLLAFLSIVLVCFTLNWPALRWLAFNTPSATASLSFAQKILQAFPAALDTWLSLYRAYLDWPLGSWPLLLLIAGGVFFGKNRELKWRFFFFLFAVQPAFYFICRYSSTYFFGERYHSPFYGFGFVGLVLLASTALDLIASKWKGRAFTRAAWAAVIVLLFLIAYLPILRVFAPKPNPLTTLKAAGSQLNFSQNFREQKFVQETKLPLLWVHDSCWESDNPIYYLSYNSAITSEIQNYIHSYPHGFLVVNSKGCEQQPAQSSENVRHFYSLHKQSVLVLREKLSSREECMKRAVGAFPKKITLSLMPETVTNRCVWVARGVESWEDAKQVVKAVQFPHQPELFP